MKRVSEKCEPLSGAAIFEEIMADNFSNLLQNNNHTPKKLNKLQVG